MTSNELSRRERAAVLWAEHVTKNTARDRDDVFAQVREEFEETEIVELTM
ncbi:MAG: carboxymuconolactone decarboxylase family protein, partial [Rhodospirillales bacterium]|nr:carboxymuconolactone decarboxylase family protein [Rhodospirillales bacterium]